MADKEYGIRVKIDPAAAKSGGREVEGALDRIEQRGRRVEEALKKALGAAAFGVGLNSVIQMADAYDKATNAVRAQTTSLAEAEAVQKVLVQTADRSHTSLEETVRLFRELSEASRELGLSRKQVIDMVETLQKLQFADGGTGKALTALSQIKLALSQGALSGIQLREVLRDLPELADALVRVLGAKSATELKALGDRGRITADVIVRAFEQMRGEVDGKFKNAITNTGAALTSFNVQFQRAFSEFARASGLTDALVGGLKFLTDNADSLVRVLTALGVVIAVALAPAAVGAVVAAIAALVSPIGLLATAIALVVAHSDKLPFVRQALTALGSVAKTVLTYMRDVITAVGDFLGKLTLGSLQVAIFDVMITVLNSLANALELVGSAMAKIPGLRTAGGAILGSSSYLSSVGAALKASRDAVEAADLAAREQGRRPLEVDITRPGTRTAGLNPVEQRHAEMLRAVNRELEKEHELLLLNEREQEVRNKLFAIEERFIQAKTPLTASERAAVEQRIRELQSLKETLTVVSDATKSLFKGMEDSIVSFVQTGSFEFKKFADQVIADMVRIALQAYVTKPLLGGVQSLAGGLLGGSTTTGPGGWQTTTTPSLFGFANGGEFTVGGGGMTDSQLVAFRATAGERVAVTRPGEGGSSGSPVAVNVYNSSGEPAEVRDRTQGGQRVVDVVIGSVRKGISEGEFDGVMGSRYGARPSTKRR